MVVRIKVQITDAVPQLTSHDVTKC